MSSIFTTHTAAAHEALWHLPEPVFKL